MMKGTIAFETSIQSVSKVGKFLVIIYRNCIVFVEARYPFRVKMNFDFHDQMLMSIEYIPSEDQFVLFVTEDCNLNSTNEYNYKYEFLNEMTEKDVDGPEAKRIVRRLKRKYCDDPDSAFWYYVNRGSQIIIILF